MAGSLTNHHAVLSPKPLGIILCSLLTLTLLTYYHRNPTADDAWFAEQSYWLQKDGVIRSNFFRGLLGWDQQLLVSHKLFLLAGAGLIKLFGYQLPVVQFVGLLAFVVLVGQISFYVYQQEKKTASWLLLVVLILIFSNRLLIKMSFENRPEMMLAAFGFGSFLCLNARKPTALKTGLAGFLAGLALLTHLNGVIYLTAGFVTLLYRQQYKSALVFAVVGGLTGLAYFIDVIQAANGFESWYHQFRHDPATQNAFGLYSKLLVMLTYPTLFFQPPEVAALSLLFVFMLWNQRRFIREMPAVLKLYTVFLILSFWFITKKNSGLYCVLFMPFMLCIIYELYRLKPFVNSALKVVLGLYFIIGLYGAIEIIIKNFRVDYLPVSHQKLRPVIPENQTGLVPLLFFFDEYDRYPYLLAYDTYKFTSPDSASSASSMARWANRNKVGFLVMDYQLSREDCYPEPGTAALPHYQLRFFDGRFAVYSHQ